MAHLLLDGARAPVEVLESLVRTYLVRVHKELAISDAIAQKMSEGSRVELVIGDNPPVPCTISGEEGGALRLIRGTRVA